MTSNLYLLALLLAGVAAAVVYVLSTALPNLSRDRFLLRMLDAREHLELLLVEHRGLVGDADVLETASLLDELIQHPHPVGIGPVMAAVFDGRPTPPPAPRYVTAPADVRRSLRRLDRTIGTEIMRASFFGSRLYPLTWVGWPVVQLYIRAARSKAKSAARETRVETVAAEAVHIHIEEDFVRGLALRRQPAGV